MSVYRLFDHLRENEVKWGLEQATYHRGEVDFSSNSTTVTNSSYIASHKTNGTFTWKMIPVCVEEIHWCFGGFEPSPESSHLLNQIRSGLSCRTLKILWVFRHSVLLQEIYSCNIKLKYLHQLSVWGFLLSLLTGLQTKKLWILSHTQWHIHFLLTWNFSGTFYSLHFNLLSP